MINDFLNRSPVFKSTIGVNLNQQRLFPRSAGEREKRRTTTDRERGLPERRKERGEKKPPQHNGGRRQRGEQ